MFNLTVRFGTLLPALLFLGSTTLVSAADAGVKPVGRDGHVLNLDFEDGTLKDWTATGTAFNKQPIRGDTVVARRDDMKSGHQGEYWIGTFEVAGDRPVGTLTSAPFKVTQPFASFLIGGGNHEGIRVELADAADKKVFFKVSGRDTEEMRPMVVDLHSQMGKEIFIKLVDQETGGWGHINFDDFKLYAARPVFANEFKPAKPSVAAPADVFQFSGLSPAEAAKAMTLPPGFKAQLFAGEPDVKQPIAFAIDHRGRIWVAEGYTYPQRAPEGQGKDRIIVFEDTDGDGKFDKRTVFMEGLNLVSGLEVGFGGVWVGAAPYLMFIPMTDGDAPKPSGAPQILLDGWGYQDTHETLNSFTWGPDGWLYGCHGVFTHSTVGKPGTPRNQRTVVTCGVWRFHPTKHEFEYFAEGTSNPWGIDFDEHGQCIIEGCVIPHLWHMIQGGYYERQGGQHSNPYVFDDIRTIADHLHYTGDKGPHAGNGRSAAAGGGHAHAGLMVYQGESWPEQFRGQYYMNNIHGAVINMDSPERQGSGFVGHHKPDFISFNDQWSQIINLQADQDGSVYMIDWYDRLQCHNTDPNSPDRSNGRIFKVVYGDTKTTPVDVEKLTDAELLRHVISRNEWMSRHARRQLQERAAAGKLGPDALNPCLVELAGAEGPRAKTIVISPERKLRDMWALQVTGKFASAEVRGKSLAALLLEDVNEYVRAWAIQLACEDRKVSPALLQKFAELATTDASPVVRLYLASAMERLPAADRWDVVTALAAHGEDARDHNLPLMLWYAAEPLATNDATRALALASSTKLPHLLQFTARRLALTGAAEALAAVTRSLGQVPDDARRMEILNGLSQAFRGQRRAAMPAGWEALETSLGASPNAEIRAEMQSLSLVFGSANALASLRKTLMDESLDAAARRTAMAALLAAHDAQLAPLLQRLLTNVGLQGPALRGLASYDDPITPEAILAVYPSLDPASRADALNTLVSRLAFARPLLAAVAGGAVPVKDLTADLVRQLRGLKDAEVEKQVLKLWGVSRDSSADKQAEILKYRRMYTSNGSQGDAPHGRAVFARTCQQCHTLYDTGGKVGPDLTGSNRGDLDYLLMNIVDPSAVIPNDYRAWNLETKDGRTITGIVSRQDEKTVTVVMPSETLVLPRAEIETMRESALSMMPDGLLQSLNDTEVRDLIYYLKRPGQVPLPPPTMIPADPKEFFNGKDLNSWDGDFSLWSVQNGEIVGRTATGLKHNEFLKSRMVLENFRLVVQVKLTPDKENSGVQFRSERFGEYEMKGPQADIGVGWWGKLYEENGRAIIWPKPGDPYVNKNEWNTYEILAVDGKIRTAINGHLCVDMDDPKISRRGITGLQMHSGGPMEVRYKDIKLELNPKFEMTTVK